MYFQKTVGLYALTQCTTGFGAKTQNLGIFENFCVKSSLTVCKVTFNCKLQKEIGEQAVLLAPQIILLGKQLLPCVCSPGSRAYMQYGYY